MKHFNSRIWLPKFLAICIGLTSTTGALAQSFRAYSNPVCPGQTEVYTLENIPAGYRLDGPTATGGTLNNTPTISNGTATFQVRWNNVNSGSVTPRLQSPIKDSNGNITGWANVPVTAPSVGIKSVFGRTPLQINGTGTVDLPLCGGAQAVTLTLPQEFYAGAPSVAIADYAWAVPAPFTVSGVPLAAGFSPSRYLSGRSLTLNVPAGQFNAEVRVVMYVRDCNENSAYGNPPATLVSFDQRITVRRVPPVVTGITPSRTLLTCGDQRPLTLTATTSQAGAAAFGWTLPQGWAFAAGSSTTAATVSVVPPGNGPAGGGTTFTGTVSAVYTCVSPAYSTPPAPFTVNYSNQVATPAITSPAAQPYGQAYTLCGPTTFTATPGAGSYRWTTTWGDDFVTTANTTTITPPSITTGYGNGSGYGTVRVQAQNANFGCADSAPAGYYVVYGPPAPQEVVYDDHDLCNTGLVAFQIYDKVPAGYQWYITGGSGTLRFGSTGERVQVYLRDRTGSFSLSVVPTNACGTSYAYEYQVGTFYNADFDYTCGVSAGRMAVAPNPATNEVVVQFDPTAPAEPAARFKANRTPATRSARALPVRQRTAALNRGEYVVHLYDRFGQEVKTAATHGRQLRLSVVTLPAGTYFLRAVRGAEVVSQQLLVQH